jgi:tripartite-type tricarboxylate transporter receptor subunit TctC
MARKAISLRQWMVGVLAVPAVLAATAAGAWSDKPVRFVVPAPPGGTIDVIARVAGEQLAASIAQPVIVDNRPGAGGAIAVQAVLNAAPDGQTLLFTASNVLTEIPHVLKLNYDTLKDLKPVAEIGRAYLVMVAHPGVPAGTLKELIAYAKANRGKLAYASYSPGTASHYSGLILNQKVGIDLLHVPYKGSPPGLTDVIAGQVPLMFDGAVTSLPMLKAGKIKAYAVSSPARLAQLPNVPTFAELGYPEMEFWNWLGAVATSKMAPELIARIHAALLKSAAMPKARERIAELGFEHSPASTPAQLGELVRKDFERNAAIVKAFNIKLD